MQNQVSVPPDDEAVRLVNETVRFLRWLANWWERNGVRIVCRMIK